MEGWAGYPTPAQRLKSLFGAKQQHKQNLYPVIQPCPQEGILLFFTDKLHFARHLVCNDNRFQKNDSNAKMA